MQTSFSHTGYFHYHHNGTSGIQCTP